MDMEYSEDLDGGHVPSLPPEPPALTARELRILELIAAGRSSRQVGAQLHVSAKDVDYHVDRLFEKLYCRSRPELVARAYALGLLKSSSWPPEADHRDHT
jgi:DNA-binding CsgD family transcriptional regulator